MGKKERRGEWNRAGRNEWGVRVGESGREMELPKKWERRDMRGWALTGPVVGCPTLHGEGTTGCVGRTQDWGAPYFRERRGKAVGRPPHPGAPPHSLERWQLLPLAGGVGRRVPVTTSPRLELELSPDLLCGQRGKWSCEQRGGCEGGGILFSHMLPCPQDSPAPLVMPQADLCPQGNRSTPEA